MGGRRGRAPLVDARREVSDGQREDDDGSHERGENQANATDNQRRRCRALAALGDLDEVLDFMMGCLEWVANDGLCFVVLHRFASRRGPHGRRASEEARIAIAELMAPPPYGAEARSPRLHEPATLRR